MVAKFFRLQLKQPIQGDWVSTCKKNLKEMNIGLTWNEIKIMSKNEDMSHIYQCEYLNEQESKIKYEKIFNGNLIEQTTVFRIFEQNMKKRNKEKLIERKPPSDPFCDPLNCGKFSIG